MASYWPAGTRSVSCQMPTSPEAFATRLYQRHTGRVEVARVAGEALHVLEAAPVLDDCGPAVEQAGAEHDEVALDLGRVLPGWIVAMVPPPVADSPVRGLWADARRPSFPDVRGSFPR
jgi:hypothetical protein